MYPTINPSIEEVADIRVSDRSATLLELLIELPESEEPSTQGRGRPKTVGYADMSTDERRSYKAERARERRARIKASIVEDGVVPYDADTAREALADAALIILAGGHEGSENIRRYLRAVFSSKPGAPMSIEAAAKSGKMRPRYIKLSQPK